MTDKRLPSKVDVTSADKQLKPKKKNVFSRISAAITGKSKDGTSSKHNATLNNHNATSSKHNATLNNHNATSSKHNATSSKHNSTSKPPAIHIQEEQHTRAGPLVRSTATQSMRVGRSDRVRPRSVGAVLSDSVVSTYQDHYQSPEEQSRKLQSLNLATSLKNINSFSPQTSTTYRSSFRWDSNPSSPTNDVVQEPSNYIKGPRKVPSSLGLEPDNRRRRPKSAIDMTTLHSPTDTRQTSNGGLERFPNYRLRTACIDNVAELLSPMSPQNSSALYQRYNGVNNVTPETKTNNLTPVKANSHYASHNGRLTPNSNGISGFHFGSDRRNLEVNTPRRLAASQSQLRGSNGFAYGSESSP